MKLKRKQKIVDLLAFIIPFIGLTLGLFVVERSSAGFGYTVIAAGKRAAADGPSYVFYETFDTTPGADNTWSTLVGAPDYDSATSVSGEGLDLFDAAGPEDIQSSDFTEISGTSYASLGIRMSDGRPSATTYIYYNGASNYLAVDTSGVIKYYTGGSTVTMVDESGGALALADGDTGWFYIKHKFIQGSANDTVNQFWYCTDKTFGSNSASTSNGTNYNARSVIRLRNSQTNEIHIYFDEVIIDDEDIASIP